MLKEMCAEAGISTHYTDHSLRAYSATTMLQAGVFEKLIKQRTTKDQPKITAVPTSI